MIRDDGPPGGTATIGQTLLQSIRGDILRGRLKPGQRLRLERMREAYGASVTTLREMLNRLVAESLVIAEGQRGFEVAPVRVRELRELAEMRIMLECHAMRQSFAQGRLPWEAEVVSAHHMLRSVEHGLMGGEADAVAQWVHYDWNFHRALVSACDMPTLMATHGNIFDRYIRYHLLALDFRGAAVAEDHAQLRDLALARRTEDAGALLVRHIRAGMEHVIASGRIPG
ncbi:GntR family transcriptional regulator [Paracoccus spongiarum]|uniref:GntR family transcriptional regulator n=1 Tax=Paracoccus spongiarum TaxID=3064387 RepID=A0ABT9JC92_9RHOB|nr:GntR family transcriptional regulator [Paracoccus sp. 2205BS29-5]MDP5307433.1 GntR family transcriptional regulator [Paracoccus sp. 2205BS29-5]